jgi:alkanesulfonate monooxygenase SsuD/methylene tetrahydromethanopterin reductase-like flavin-dependent oxidoreductase (luciferase family)
VLIGGTGEKRTLRLVAEYAQAANFFDVPDGGATLQHKFQVLADHCAAVGRDYDDIERTVTTAVQPTESAEQLAARCRGLQSLGTDHVVLMIRGGPWRVDAVATLADTADLLAGEP